MAARVRAGRLWCMTRRGGAVAPVVWAPRCWAKKPLFPRLALRLAGLRIGAMGSPDKAQRAAIRERLWSRCA
ncbi:conserved hypothetical protein [Klebsiella pneumoniae]|nr:conserved hypothetical protein [Klebsiella pneumoniae]